MYRLINSYLLVMIALKELQIPYIKHHPILQTSFKLKHHIQALKEKIGVKSESTQALNHDAKTSDSLNKLGLCYYQSLQAKRANDKK